MPITGIGSASVLAESRGASTPLRSCGAHDAQKPWGRDGGPRHRHCRCTKSAANHNVSPRIITPTHQKVMHKKCRTVIITYRGKPREVF